MLKSKNLGECPAIGHDGSGNLGPGHRAGSIGGSFQGLSRGNQVLRIIFGWRRRDLISEIRTFSRQLQHSQNLFTFQHWGFPWNRRAGSDLYT